jgi:hypothetical protein
LNLCKFDRLDPSAELPDTHKFHIQQVPFTVRFWRMQPTHRLIHNSPLLAIPGVSHETYATDLLHCWHRGPETDWIAESLWFIILEASKRAELSILEQRDIQRVVLQEIKVELKSFYRWKKDNDSHWAEHGSEV